MSNSRFSCSSTETWDFRNRSLGTPTEGYFNSAACLAFWIISLATRNKLAKLMTVVLHLLSCSSDLESLNVSG